MAETFKNQAQKHVMTLDDVNYLLNREQNNSNVANSAKKDMLNQMKNAKLIVSLYLTYLNPS